MKGLIITNPKDLESCQESMECNGGDSVFIITVEELSSAGKAHYYAQEMKKYRFSKDPDEQSNEKAIDCARKSLRWFRETEGNLPQDEAYVNVVLAEMLTEQKSHLGLIHAFDALEYWLNVRGNERHIVDHNVERAMKVVEQFVTPEYEHDLLPVAEEWIGECTKEVGLSCWFFLEKHSPPEEYKQLRTPLEPYAGFEGEITSGDLIWLWRNQRTLEFRKFRDEFEQAMKELKEERKQQIVEKLRKTRYMEDWEEDQECPQKGEY